MSPYERTALFTVFAGAGSTRKLIDLTRTAEELNQDKGYGFNTHVYRQKGLHLT